MGALRSTAQMVSYEVSIGFIILTVIFLSGSMNLTEIVNTQSGGIWNWNMFLLNPTSLKIFLFPIMFYMGILFFISALAETNRPPFDLPEAETGFQFLPPIFWFLLKTAFLFFMFAMVKAIVPRYRYDQLMRLGWKVFLPTSLVAVAIVSTFVVFLGDKI